MRWLRVALLGGALAGALLAGCAGLVGIPDVTVETDASDDASGNGEGASDDDGGPCGRVATDGATRAGPDMVRVDAPQGSYCIDSTEVTIGQFNAFVLATSGTLVDVPDACAGAQPTPLVDNVSDPQLPVDHLGECHAWSYCAWAGKRLCGALGDGGIVGPSSVPEDTEWGFACVNGTANDPYPYGTTYQPGTCNVDDPDAGPVAVKSRAGCHGTTPPFDRIYDMVGNVWEFTNTFGGQNGTVAYPAGGAWDTTTIDPTGGGCFRVENFDGVAFDDLESGFRCCADL